MSTKRYDKNQRRDNTEDDDEVCTEWSEPENMLTYANGATLQQRQESE